MSEIVDISISLVKLILTLGKFIFSLRIISEIKQLSGPMADWILAQIKETGRYPHNQ